MMGSTIGLQSRGLVALLLPFLVLVAARCQNTLDLTQAQVGQLRSLIKTYLEESGAPSVAVAVAKDGKVVWEEGFGWADREKKIPATPQTMYAIASISKPMTATAVMLLAERGLVDLHKPANAYLAQPGLRSFAGSPDEVTVKRILHHTAGLPMYWQFSKRESPGRPGPDDLVQRFGIVVAPPGDRYEYSNLGYSVLATIVERVSGQTFGEFMANEIFVPLGLHRTRIYLEPPSADSIAPRYSENAEPAVLYDSPRRGSTGVYASVHDLIRFGMFHLKNQLPDQKQILGAEAIEAMQEAVDPRLPTSRYKMGWDVGERFGYKVVTHGGWMPGVRAMLLLLPSENVAVAVISNGESLEPPKVYDPILASLLPAYGEQWKKQQRGGGPGRPGPFSPPPPLVGQWSGTITTYEQALPVGLVCRSDGSVRLLLGGDHGPVREISELASPPRMQGGLFIVNFKAEFPLSEARQAPHTTYLKMKLGEDKMSGFVLAVGEKEEFGLPSFIELVKKKE